LFMKPPDIRQLSMNCVGLGRDLGLAPTNAQYVVISDLGICDMPTQVLQLLLQQQQQLLLLLLVLLLLLQRSVNCKELGRDLGLSVTWVSATGNRHRRTISSSALLYYQSTKSVLLLIQILHFLFNKLTFHG